MLSLFLTLKSSLLSIPLYANDQGFWLSYHLWLYTLHSSFPGFVSVSLYAGLHRAFPSAHYSSWAKLKMSSKTKQRTNKKKTVPKGQLRTFLVKWAKTLGWERVKSIFNLSWKEAGGQRNSPSHHLSIRSCTESRSSMWVYSECINRRHVFPKFVLHISKAFKDCRVFYCRHAKFWMLIK